MICKADLHIHSLDSVDSILSLEQIVREARAAGLNIIAVSDHNSYSGSEKLQALAPEGLLVVPSAEYATECGHILALFVPHQLEERYLVPIDDYHFQFREVVEGIHAAGGLAVVAHPFDKARYTLENHPALPHVDGVEAHTGHVGIRDGYDGANRLAARAAIGRGLFFTAGSDAHNPGEIGNAILTLELDEFTLDGFRAALLRRRGSVWGRDASRAKLARAQLNKCLKRPWPKCLHKLPRRLAVYAASFGIDFLKALHIKPKNRGATLIEGGELTCP